MIDSNTDSSLYYKELTFPQPLGAPKMSCLAFLQSFLGQHRQTLPQCVNLVDRTRVVIDTSLVLETLPVLAEPVHIQVKRRRWLLSCLDSGPVYQKRLCHSLEKGCFTDLQGFVAERDGSQAGRDSQNLLRSGVHDVDPKLVHRNGNSTQRCDSVDCQQTTMPVK